MAKKRPLVMPKTFLLTSRGCIDRTLEAHSRTRIGVLPTGTPSAQENSLREVELSGFSLGAGLNIEFRVHLLRGLTAVRYTVEDSS